MRRHRNLVVGYIAYQLPKIRQRGINLQIAAGVADDIYGDDQGGIEAQYCGLH